MKESPALRGGCDARSQLKCVDQKTIDELEAGAQAGPEVSSRFDEGLAPLFAEPIVFDPLDSGERGMPGLMVVAAMVLVAGMLAGGLWWKLRHRTQLAASAVPAVQVAKPTQNPVTTPPVSNAAPRHRS